MSIIRTILMLGVYAWLVGACFWTLAALYLSIFKQDA